MMARSARCGLWWPGFVVVVLVMVAGEALAQDAAPASSPVYAVRGRMPGCAVERVDPVLPSPVGSDVIMILAVTTDAEGAPTDVRLVRGLPSLAQPTIDAVRQWRFVPGVDRTTLVGLNLLSRRLDGQPAAPVEPSPTTVRAPRKIRDVKPTYPAEAQRRRTEGMVMIDTVIDPDGIVANACVLRPVEGLSEAALEAVMGWRFEPRTDGHRLRMVVTTRFALGRR